jgi:hypothetical protein
MGMGAPVLSGEKNLAGITPEYRIAEAEFLSALKQRLKFLGMKLFDSSTVYLN